jgi:hypothetical protein
MNWWGQELVNPFWSSEMGGCSDSGNTAAIITRMKETPVEVMIYIYDMFGNLVAGPEDHPSLKVARTAYELFWEGEDALTGSCKKTAVMDYNTLKGCSNRTNGDYSNCMLVWNCINAKGRLVAPGGYIVRKVINTSMDPLEEEIIKVIVTSGSKNQTLD